MSRGHKTVLIVDDEKTLLYTFSNSLKAYASDLEIITAENGLQAVEKLKGAHVDFVVTDLRMPEMDGFQLLIHMKKHYPGIPVLVMTAAGSPEVADRLKTLGMLSYLEKPVNIKELALKIFQGISTSSEGKLFGVTLAGFLQLIVMERRSCALKVRCRDRSGTLLIKDGELIDARTDDQTGEAAACEIVTWEDTEIRMGNYTGERRKNIDTALSEILLDAFRMKDEREKASRPRPPVDDAVLDEEPREASGAPRPPTGDTAESVSGAAHAAPDAPEEKGAPGAEPRETPKDVPGSNEADRAAAALAPGSGPGDDAAEGGLAAAPVENPAATLNALLSELARLRGVNAACLVGSDGFLIDSVSNVKLEADLVGAIASSGFGASESIGREMGRGALEITMLEFEQGPVIIVPLGTEFLLVIVAARNVSLGMLRLKIKRLGTEIAAAAAAV